MIISFRIAAAALARPEHHLLDSALRFAAERGVVRKELDDGMLAAETTFAAWAELGSLADTLADPDEHADAESLLAQCDAAVANGDAAEARDASRPRFCTAVAGAASLLYGGRGRGFADPGRCPGLSPCAPLGLGNRKHLCQTRLAILENG